MKNYEPLIKGVLLLGHVIILGFGRGGKTVHIMLVYNWPTRPYIWICLASCYIVTLYWARREKKYI
jgi:hypothetical protein